MRVAVVGAGYVGLVTAACLSEFGFEVTCIDKEADKVERLRQGEIPIHEPGLDGLVFANRRAGRLDFSDDLSGAVRGAGVVFIAVGTPSRRGEDAADLAFVRAAAEQIGRALNGFTVVVTKSTVPVGTARMLERLIRDVRPDANFAMASNPEFLREGSAVEDFLRPDRIVVGLSSAQARERMSELYRPLMLRDVPVLFTNFETAELIKYAANAYLATRIGFINEMADLCEAVGADVSAVTRGMGLDRRIGLHYLQPGPGFGGSCFPKDTRALTSIAKQAGTRSRIVEAVIEANAARKDRLAERIADAVGGSLRNKRVAVLGISFKAETDDLREAASLAVIPALQKEGATIAAYDPVAIAAARPLLPDVTWCGDAYETAKDADAIVVLTEWNEFRGLDLRRLAAQMREPVLIDFRNIYSAGDVAKTPFVYHSLGRATVSPGS
ncbi:MAG TPA: UDP-glucose/GDP-mannose dehydrogenase family protein [Aestuariivirgaceae bacterium]|jgi:UDPglucose 6-dehydrogenase|nr:UDP-glucose/GDP-mannose dehydrogenase family protein [Aestuariivirgaceae bacterium]